MNNICKNLYILINCSIKNINEYKMNFILLTGIIISGEMMNKIASTNLTLSQK